MKTLLVIILMFIVWFISTQFGINWPRVASSDLSPPSPKPGAGLLPREDFAPELSIEELVFEKINEVRVENNREPLEWSQHLTQKAQEHSLWMADTGKFMHSTYNYCENIWWGIGISVPRLPARIIKSWMGSSGHRANLLEVEISKCGIGIAYDANTRGHYATFMAY